MADAFLLLPVGASYFKAAKKVANAVDSLGDVGKAAGKTAKNTARVRFLEKGGQSKIDRQEFRKMKQHHWKKEAHKKDGGDYTPDDLRRIQDGRAAMGDDGCPMELHHVDGTPTGGLKPMTRTDHRLGENYKKNHPWLK